MKERCQSLSLYCQHKIWEKRAWSSFHLKDIAQGLDKTTVWLSNG